MPTVTFNEESYTCSIALKGTDYIHLLNQDGDMIAAFDGIVSFTDFSISDGDWTSPKDDNSLPLAVIREDGTQGQAEYTAADIVAAQSAAGAAHEAATAAQSKADSAHSAAQSAQNAAQTAQTTAQSALTTAQAAQTAVGAISLSSFGVTATATELNYVDGVTSSIQTQLDGKAAKDHTHSYLPLAGGTLTGKLYLTSGVHYGTSLPSSGSTGQIFFLKV